MPGLLGKAVLLLDQHSSVFGRMDRTSGSRGTVGLWDRCSTCFISFPKFGLWNTKECLVHKLRRSLARISKERTSNHCPLQTNIVEADE